jgi:hypothetical protein
MNLATLWPCERHDFGKVTVLSACIIFVVAASLCLFVSWQLRVLAADDSYIHLRIADRLVHTGHPFYNDNERVMVTSSPIWTVLLAASGYLFHGVPAALPIEAVAVGLSCSMGFLLAVAFSSCHNTSRRLRAAYISLVTSAIFLILLPTSISQMESPVAVMLLLAGLLLWYQDSVFWLGVLVLAAFVRYEYFALGGLLFAFAAIKRSLRPSSIVIASALFLGGVAWLEYQFGTVVPNTLKAKSIVYHVRMIDSMRGLELHTRQAFFLTLAVIALTLTRSRWRLTVPHVLFLCGIFLDVLYIAHRTFIFPWYVPLTLTPIVLGLLFANAPSPGNWTPLFIAFTAFMLLPLRMYPPEINAAIARQPWIDTSDIFDIRTRQYLLIGDAIRTICPNARVLSSEIGGLGYGFKGRLLDGVGLATPSAIKYHPMRVPQDRDDGANGAIPPGFVVEMRPDVVVTYEMFSRAFRRDYDRSVFDDLVVPPLPVQEGAKVASTNPCPIRMGNCWRNEHVHVFVSRQGACPVQALTDAVKQRIATE